MYYGARAAPDEPIAIYLSELEGTPLIIVTKQSDIPRQVELIDKGARRVLDNKESTEQMIRDNKPTPGQHHD